MERENATIAGKRALKEQAQQALEREKDWNLLIEQAHKSLHEEENCPVCGNVIKNLQPPKGQNVLDELRLRLKQADDEVQKSETAIAASGKAIKRLTKQAADNEKDLNSKAADRKTQWEQVSKLLVQCGKKHDEIGTIEQADALIHAIDDEIKVLNETLAQANLLNNNIAAERDKLDQLTKQHNAAQIRLNQVNESIKHQGQVIADSQSRLEARTHELDELLNMSDWQDMVAKSPDFIDELEQKAIHYQQQAKAAQQLEHSINVAKAIIPAMQENKANITGLVDNGLDSDEVPDKLDELWRQFENKNINWNNLLNNQSEIAERAHQALDKYLIEQPDMNIECLAAIDKHAQAEISNLKHAHHELAERITHMQGEIASLTRQQADIKAKKPDFIEENREKLASIFKECDDRFNELTDLIADRKARLKADDDNVKAVGEKQQALERAEAVYKQWDEFKEMLGDSTGTKFRKIAQSYILGELLACANGYLRQFNNRYELEANPGTLIILVRDLIQGDLTTVSTLSGGESFMVSLALALALSSTTGKMFTVDTLFIDEGFGSLSPNYLDNVMETLNRLYDIGGKRVGIISHVELLKERVTTQIQVTRDPKNNTVSRIAVV